MINHFVAVNAGPNIVGEKNMEILAKLNHLFPEKYVVNPESNYYKIIHILSKGKDGENHWLRCYSTHGVGVIGSGYPLFDEKHAQITAKDQAIIDHAEIVMDLGTVDEVRTLDRHIIKTNDIIKIKEIEDYCKNIYPDQISVSMRHLTKNVHGFIKFFTLDVDKALTEQDMTLIYLMAGEVL